MAGFGVEAVRLLLKQTGTPLYGFRVGVRLKNLPSGAYIIIIYNYKELYNYMYVEFYFWAQGGGLKVD